MLRLRHFSSALHLTMGLMLMVSSHLLATLSHAQEVTKSEKRQALSQATIQADIEFPSIAGKGGDFTLFNENGAVSLSDFKGQVVIFYFGYTQCPDICPTNLNIVAQALKKLSSEELAQVQPLFISTDPGRDSPQRLAEYVKFFHPKLIGLSAAPDDLDPVVQQYGAFYEKVSYSNSAMLYGIDHTSEVYIIGRNSQLLKILPHETPVNIVLREIRSALK